MKLRLAGLTTFLLVLATGCATAEPVGRRGLLEGGQVANTRVPAPISPPTVPHLSSRRIPGLVQSPPSSGVNRRPAVEIASGGGLTWPLQQIKITSPFGRRGKEFHEGIDLKAMQGTAVMAAQEGTVIYAGNRIRGYGKMVVVRHQRQISTIYAHNSKLLVKTGQLVRQGQKIAISGKTGHVTGPHLHFEVRDGLAALNPLDYLPNRQTAAVEAPQAAPEVSGRQVSASALKPQKVAARSVRAATLVRDAE